MSDQESYVTFKGEDGHEITLEIIDFFPHEGEEYVILADTLNPGGHEHSCCCGEEHDDECCCGNDDDECTCGEKHDHECCCGDDDCSCGEEECSCGSEVDIYVLKVVTGEDGHKEFVPLDPDKEEAVFAEAQAVLSGEFDEQE